MLRKWPCNGTLQAQPSACNMGNLVKGPLFAVLPCINEKFRMQWQVEPLTARAAPLLPFQALEFHQFSFFSFFSPRRFEN